MQARLVRLRALPGVALQFELEPTSIRWGHSRLLEVAPVNFCSHLHAYASCGTDHG
jgi:hypothetical protein